MKKLLWLFVLLSGVVAGSYAQKINASRKSDADQKAKTLQRQLSLTNEQTARISMIYQDAYVKFDEIKVKAKGNTDKMTVAYQPLVKETIAKIKGVLQPRQSVEYDKLQKRDAESYEGWAPNQSVKD